ncbi:hypothetical protein PanWU01x14_048870 [Parasponia andersonii]|uniref:Uncharacterized protein n=1 Tax=Parasponia andersonii TaxID=3476 RepID=A0A2P5DMG0_PARAD|nr:hypothetical protein PanWU01x14_048870 [Parasponia andersonii]
MKSDLPLFLLEPEPPPRRPLPPSSSSSSSNSSTSSSRAWPGSSPYSSSSSSGSMSSSSSCLRRSGMGGSLIEWSFSQVVVLKAVKNPRERCIYMNIYIYMTVLVL